MKIEWNKVTWYSWVAALIVFGGVFFLGIWLGMQIQMAKFAPIDEQAPTPPVQIINRVIYDCDGGKQIKANFEQYVSTLSPAPNLVSISTSGGINTTLSQVISADGGRYANADESLVFWTKGNGAFIMQGTGSAATTTYANCTQVSASH